MNADDNGEGGTFALYSLLLRAANVRPAGRATHETDAGLTKFTTHEVPAKPRRGVAAIRHAFEHSKALQTVLLVVVLLAGAGVLAGMSIGTALARGGWLLILAGGAPPPPPLPCSLHGDQRRRADARHLCGLCDRGHTDADGHLKRCAGARDVCVTSSAPRGLAPGLAPGPDPELPWPAGVVVGISIVILAGIFFMQSMGTAKVSMVFAPVIFIWFLSNAA